jgi:hypothetical protein
LKKKYNSTIIRIYLRIRMHKKLTISIEENIYNGLHEIIGRGKIGKFLSDLARPYVLKKELEKSYQTMAEDEKREKEANEWTENLITDFAHEA